MGNRDMQAQVKTPLLCIRKHMREGHWKLVPNLRAIPAGLWRKLVDRHGCATHSELCQMREQRTLELYVYLFFPERMGPGGPCPRVGR